MLNEDLKALSCADLKIKNALIAAHKAPIYALQTKLQELGAAQADFNNLVLTILQKMEAKQ